MIDWLRRLMRRPDHVEDVIAAYLDATSETELHAAEERLRASGVDVDELRSVRETTRLLRSLETVEAPRSYALTPETLADRGYSQSDIENILNPGAGWRGLRLRNAAVYVPLAIAAVALAGVALLTIGDLSEYVTDRFDSEEETALQLAVEEKQVQSSERPLAGTPRELETAAMEADVEVEEEEVATVVFEKEVEVSGETVVQDVEVEMVVEREVVVEKKVIVTLVVEKAVEVVGEVEIEREVEVLPTPVAARAAMAAEAMMTDDADEEATATPTPIPTVAPCVVLPTATPTPTGTPSASTTPEATATKSPIPTCTPTPTPSPTPNPAAMSSPTPSVPPTATMSPTPTR